jgi:hypothetical protein
MNDVPGVDDKIGSWIERIDVRNRSLEIIYSLTGVGRVQRNMSV